MNTNGQPSRDLGHTATDLPDGGGREGGPAGPRNPGASTPDGTAPETAPGAAPDQSADLEAGTYEVLRDRMSAAAADLAGRANRLNARRVETFGGFGLELLDTDRISTEHNCVPRDVVQVAGALLFGYHGRRGPEPTEIADVFALHRRVPLATTAPDAEPGAPTARWTFEPMAPDGVPGLLDDAAFQRDFTELHRYYQGARLLQLRRVSGMLLAVFQIGERLTDIRVLRWRLAADGTPSYVDSKGERDHVLPAPHDFEWTPSRREDHVLGRHPHIDVQGEVFVSCVGGSLTVRLDNDTESDAGARYREPVDEPLQSLADAEVDHARIGPLLLLRILPYNETVRRHLVYNTRTGEVVRLDGIGQACRRLPQDQGIVFPGGHYLSAAPAGSAARTFDTDTDGLEYEDTVRSPNGEDVLYVFHARARGRYLLLSYNVIRKEVATPIAADGHCLFEDGTLTVLRAASDEPTRVHPMQMWATPYVSDAYAAAQPPGEGPLARIGNAELVRGISDALSVARMADEMEPNAAVFRAIVQACGRVTDRHHWLDADQLEGLDQPLGVLRSTATQVIDEFERVQELRARAAAALETTSAEVTGLIRRARGEAPHSAAGWVTLLTELRRAQGRVESLRELRQVDHARIDALAEQVAESLESTGRRAVTQLSREDAFDATRAEIDELAAEAGEAATVADTEPYAERITEHADSLQIVTDVVGGLEIADATVRTGLLERLGEVLGAVNRARAVLDARRRELLASEGRAEFAAEFALLGQAVAGALAAAGTPEECDEQLGRLLLHLENLESRFGPLDSGEVAGDGSGGGYLARLGDQRAEIYETFAARKQAQLDERARHAERLMDSAERVLDTVTRRCRALGTLDEVNTFFASDPLVEKIRTTAAELRTVDDSVRAEELEGRLKAARQEAARALRDRADLYDVDGTIRLGRHRFGVNSQPIDLTLVPQDGTLVFAITGTDYRAAVRGGAADGAAAFWRTREFWDQPLVSESPAVYRAEHLAATLLDRAERGVDGLTLPLLHRALSAERSTERNTDRSTERNTDRNAGRGVGWGTGPDRARGRETEQPADDLLTLVRRAAEAAYDEGYDRGVHDHDAALILGTLLDLLPGADLLRFTAEVRAAAQLFWTHGTAEPRRTAWTVRAASLARARAAFGRAGAWPELVEELSEGVSGFLTTTGLRGYAATDPRSAGAGSAPDSPHAGQAPAHPVDPPTVSRYLLEELATGDPRFATSAAARDLLAGFRRALGGPEATATKEFAEDLRALGDDLPARHQVVTSWLDGYAQAHALEPTDLPEAAAIELCGPDLPRREIAAPLTTEVSGLLGGHPRVATGGNLTVRLDRFLARTTEFRTVRVPAHRAYTRERNALLTAERKRLRLDAYRPQVMSAFVRNRLLDEVYLPLIGDNLAKQLGTVGEDRRTDSQGLLLLLSPPGYGKTTLMEYVAARLGLVFVKVDGPALGHHTTSLDPTVAPDAAARREVEKINFALEMGNNVFLYLDDIQHTSPELLQKFIPLCDAQRRIDGVRVLRDDAPHDAPHAVPAGAFRVEPVTHDLRGKRFAVCMAGNPFTESGARFRVPDMLANRADVWNLGDVLSGRDHLFALSHIENALTSNPVLAPLAARERSDIDLLVRMAQGDGSVCPDQLAHPYPAADLERVLSVLRRLLHVQRTVLGVNAAYIASATQDPATRTEPPFLLQGSYRDTNKLAERIVAVMNEEELEALIDDHYQAEAQTLTTGGEANLLKLAELRGRLSPEQRQRWADIKETFRTGTRQP